MHIIMAIFTCIKVRFGNLDYRAEKLCKCRKNCQYIDKISVLERNIGCGSHARGKGLSEKIVDFFKV